MNAMKTPRITLFAWIAVAAALIAWGVGWMFLSSIRVELDARGAQLAGAQDVTARENASMRLHALARNTKDLRAQLDGLAQIDVLGIANMVESVGKIAGVKIKIGGALSGTMNEPQNAGSVPALNSLRFVVTTEGSFSALMHTAALLESLPMLSSIEQLDLERTPSTGALESRSLIWRMTTNIRVLSAANISS